jgi:hypothetical protein
VPGGGPIGLKCASISTSFVDNPVDKLVAFAPSANGRLAPPKVPNF